MDRPRPVTESPGWWSRLLVQQKVWAILLLAFVPLLAALIFQVTLITSLRSVQDERHRIILVLNQIQTLRRLVLEVEEKSLGYQLTRQESFRESLEVMEAALKPALDRTVALVGDMPGLAEDMRNVALSAGALLADRRQLARQRQDTGEGRVPGYLRSGQGRILVETLQRLRAVEDRLAQEREKIIATEERLARQVLWGLSLAAGGVLLLGLLGGRILSRSLVEPLGLLRRSVAELGGQAKSEGPLPEPGRIAIESADEIGQLARSYEEMAGRICRQVRELEAINAVGHEISTLGPDGLDGVLRRITDRAAALLQANVCLVMLRNERMGCWIVEAASGEWDDRLHKTVMLWEEFPVSVRAFETREPAFGEDLRKDLRPEVIRRNLIGESMLSVPLLDQGRPFGVLVLLQDRRVPAESWNLPLARGFAHEAAIAIANARLYDAVARKEKGLESRLRRLEHLAETLAHDLKGPGERLESLASLIAKEYGGRLDERGNRWLRMMEQNGQDLIARVHDILEVSRVGAKAEAVEAVDASLVVREVLKARADEIEKAGTHVEVAPSLPLVACHRAYLSQILDNLVSNAIKFSAGGEVVPVLRVAAERQGDRILFSVSDNGPGIPPQSRERVFEPFVRLKPEAARGSGIGLSIVRRIVELYGGKAWIEANEPAGARVCFSLPALGDLVRPSGPSGIQERTA